MDTDGEEKKRRRKYTAILPTGGGEAKKTKNMEALYEFVQYLGTGEEDGIPFTDWKGVDEYRDPVDPN